MAEGNLIPGTIIFKMGMKWVTIPPMNTGIYDKANIKMLSVSPIGDIQLAKNQLYVVGKLASNVDITIGYGWMKAHIFVTDGIPTLQYASGSDGANKRWHELGGGKPRRRNNPPLDNPIQTIRQQKAISLGNWEWLRSEVYLRDKGICWVCNEFVLLREYDLGHIIDRTNGGKDSMDNCTVMHKPCNGRKPRHNTLTEAMEWKMNLNVSLFSYKNKAATSGVQAQQAALSGVLT
jgi:5-methylcytosine-specific restriction endonuclease McrA